MTIKTKLDDGIRSTKAFVTGITPGNKDSPERDGPSITFAGGDLTGKGSVSMKSTIGTKKRKVFGANDYLERQRNLKGSQTLNSDMSAVKVPLEKSEFDAEFDNMHNNISRNMN